MILDLLTEIPHLSLTEATQRFERDHYKPHVRIQERRDRSFDSSLLSRRDVRSSSARERLKPSRRYIKRLSILRVFHDFTEK